MIAHRFRSKIWITSGLIVPTLLFFTALYSIAADVTLAWDANDPAPEGYRVFVRENGTNYNYAYPIWESDNYDQTTECTLIGLNEGTTYNFVVRAYDGDLESADSEEVIYTPPTEDSNQTNEDSEQVNDTAANNDSNQTNEDSKQVNDTAANNDSNQAPVAKAGSDQTVYEKAAVTLTGTASSDPDGSIAAYLWKQTGGTAVALSDATTANASFTAPIVDLSDDTLMFGEALTFSLTVIDDDGETDADSVTVSILKSSTTDVDGDTVPDMNDLFPDNPLEWADNDADGIGDNADPDDDNDGMSDVWEERYGLDPLTDDAALDADGDGVSNLDEYTAGSDPLAAPGNSAPDAPVIEAVSMAETVPLTPVLVTAAYFDPDNDAHFQSQWQIGTDENFGTLILDKTSKVQLTAYEVGKMVLEVDTVYFWRVRFIDTDNGVSDWSETATFTTIAAEASEDADSNGIPDDQEVADYTADVNEDGVADSMEGDIMCLNTVEGQTMIGVEPVSEGSTLVSVESIASDTIPDPSVQPGFGLIGLRLYLADGVTTATVKISFDRQVPNDAQLYKYTEENGWQVFSNAVFSANRRSVTLMLEDGGQGDEDGVVNGVIVDPSGIAYTESTNSTAVSTSDSSAASGSGSGSCFITVMDPSGGKPTDTSLSLLSRIVQTIGRFCKWTPRTTAK